MTRGFRAVFAFQERGGLFAFSQRRGPQFERTPSLPKRYGCSRSRANADTRNLTVSRGVERSICVKIFRPPCFPTSRVADSGISLPITSQEAAYPGAARLGRRGERFEDVVLELAELGAGVMEFGLE